MRGFFLSCAAMVAFVSGLLATQVEVQTKPSPTPTAAQSPTPQSSPTLASPTPAVAFPPYRPALPALGPLPQSNPTITRARLNVRPQYHPPCRRLWCTT